MPQKREPGLSLDIDCGMPFLIFLERPAFECCAVFPGESTGIIGFERRYLIKHVHRTIEIQIEKSVI
jgi:hypothetical protein